MKYITVGITALLFNILPSAGLRIYNENHSSEIFKRNTPLNTTLSATNIVAIMNEIDRVKKEQREMRKIQRAGGKGGGISSMPPMINSRGGNEIPTNSNTGNISPEVGPNIQPNRNQGRPINRNQRNNPNTTDSTGGGDIGGGNGGQNREPMGNNDSRRPIIDSIAPGPNNGVPVTSSNSPISTNNNGNDKDINNLMDSLLNIIGRIGAKQN